VASTSGSGGGGNFDEGTSLGLGGVEGVGLGVGLVSLVISLLTGLGDLSTGAGLGLYQLV
jgi:hypothetical protein